MGARNSYGFTIIETMLFLAVTGLLVMGVLVGTSISLNNQRYRDAVESFKTVLQDQYAELGSVKNDRGNTWTCDSDAKPITGGSQYRGQSKCMIVGRYLAIQNENIRAYTVLAHERASGIPATDDIAALRTKYTYNVMYSDVTPTTMEWGTKIAWPSKGDGERPVGTARSLGVLFIRSPESGTIYTFSGDSVPSSGAAINSATFTGLMNAGETIPGQNSRTICVEGSGLATAGGMAVYINPLATGSSSIEIRSNDTSVELGGAGASRC